MRVLTLYRRFATLKMFKKLLHFCNFRSYPYFLNGVPLFVGNHNKFSAYQSLKFNIDESIAYRNINLSEFSHFSKGTKIVLQGHIVIFNEYSIE